MEQRTEDSLLHFIGVFEKKRHFEQEYLLKTLI